MASKVTWRPSDFRGADREEQLRRHAAFIVLRTLREGRATYRRIVRHESKDGHDSAATLARTVAVGYALALRDVREVLDSEVLQRRSPVNGA